MKLTEELRKEVEKSQCIGKIQRVQEKKKYYKNMCRRMKEDMVEMKGRWER